MGNEQRFRKAEAALWASVGATPTERRLRLEHSGTDVRVQEVGVGPPVVYIHGASNAGTSWAPLVARMPGFRHILLDRPGCGLSQPMATPLTDVTRLKTFGDTVVVDVLDALELTRAHLVATSLGGHFGIRSAAAAPERIDKFVLVGWPAGAPMKATPLILRVAQLPALGKVMTKMPVPRSAVRMILKQIGLGNALATGGFSEEALMWFQSVLRDTNTMRNEIDGVPPLTTLRGTNEEMLHGDDVLARISEPTLVLWGSDDPMGGEDIARRLTTRLPNARLEMMNGAGHAPWMDDVAEVAARLEAFLRS